MRILKFYAVWCGPCKVLNKQLESFKDYPIESVNIDENPDLVEKYGIISVPTTIILRDEEEVLRYRGLINPKIMSADIKNLRQ